jgi:putative aldouronate transport system substrate-binding protein
LSAFAVVNTQCVFLWDDNGKVVFEPTSEKWREGLKFLRRLCAENLLSPLSFTQNLQSLKQMVNDPNNVCGGFVALGIGLVAQQNDAAVIARYDGVAPVSGPDGFRGSVYSEAPPLASGVITTASQHPEVVFRLFDYMIGYEGSTWSRYGVKGVNWDDPAPDLLSKFGEPATMEIIKDAWQAPQNSHWQNYNPFINDIHNDGAGSRNPNEHEKKNAVLALDYLETEFKQSIPALIYDLADMEKVNEITVALNDYVKQTIAKFSTGELNPESDADWEKYLKEYESIGLSEFMEIAQRTYDRMSNE